ncbi:LysR family transcriptional regulator [Skermanella stibiiresistens SB22]|uniref:LysR family transcriptional regulator n=1 Tax=Skermanella stibiiresistens SB22 TaxID=1385369 RepID=W9H3I4_9PROT|nr:LysR family transcriptional regulator [Skermanella stibiiresistens]EWY40750.1 LysR family transcriptional regulator [Skermanella stibiiresistens SB22]
MRRLDNIDLRLLRVFVTLADAGGFADAQILLNLSQSTLSTHLSALERKLGAPLCERGRRGFRLTEFGEATYDAAKRLFVEIDAFQSRIGRDRVKLMGQLRIGIVDGVATSPELGIHGALSRYCEYAPDVFIDLLLGIPAELETAVADGTRDVVVGPMSQKVPGLTYIPIYREPHALYCGGSHPLFGVPDDAIDRAAIEEAPFAVRGYLHFDDLYRANHPRPCGTVKHMEAQVMMVLSGRFIGFLPCHIGGDWVRRGLMRALMPKTYSFSSTHFVATRTADARRPVVQAFVREVKRQAAG